MEVVLKLLIHQSLLGVFGSLDGVIDDVKSEQNLQVLTALFAKHDLQHRIAYLKLKTMVLKGLLRLGDEHIDSSRQAKGF